MPANFWFLNFYCVLFYTRCRNSSEKYIHTTIILLLVTIHSNREQINNETTSSIYMQIATWRSSDFRLQKSSEYRGHSRAKERSPSLLNCHHCWRRDRQSAPRFNARISRWIRRCLSLTLTWLARARGTRPSFLPSFLPLIKLLISPLESCKSFFSLSPVQGGHLSQASSFILQRISRGQNLKFKAWLWSWF